MTMQIDPDTAAGATVLDVALARAAEADEKPVAGFNSGLANLPDVAGMSLRDLDELPAGDESALGLALRRILEDEDADSVAGFTSRI